MFIAGAPPVGPLEEPARDGHAGSDDDYGDGRQRVDVRVTPSFTLDQMRIGKVVLPGPVTKFEMTTSSSEIVKASSHPDRIAGAITGSVTSRSTCQGFEPRSMAASSIETSAWTMRLWTMVVTK